MSDDVSLSRRQNCKLHYTYLGVAKIRYNRLTVGKTCNRIWSRSVEFTNCQIKPSTQHRY